MEAVKKYWLWGIFISILSVFAMSYNVNALDFTVDYNSYERITIPENPNITCVSNSGTISNVTSCDILPTSNGNIQINQIYAYQGLSNLKKGDLIEFYLKINNTDLYYIQAGDLNIKNFNTYYGSYYSVLSVEEVLGDDLIRLNTFYGTNADDQLNYIDINNFYHSYKVFRIVLRVRQDFPSGTTAQYGLYSPNGIFQFYTNFRDFSTVNVSIFGAQLLRYTGSEENKEVQEKTQEAVDDSQAAGGSSSQSAQSGTTGLLNAITGAVNVISSASPTNCKINGNMGNLDMGQLDLCANPAPAFVQTIGSLILILMCVPLAISLFNRFIAIFRSFQS